MKAEVLVLFVFAIGGLAGCTAAEENKTINSERAAVSHAQKETAVAGTQTVKDLQDMQKEAIGGFQKIREDSVKGGTALSKETESGAHALEESAKGVQQFSHDAAKNASTMGDAIKKFDDDAKNNATSAHPEPAKSTH